MERQKKKTFPTWLGSVCHRKDGGVYIRVGKDVELRKGELLSVVDPKAKLTDEQKEELAEAGILKIKNGKYERTIYASTFRDIYRLPDLDSPGAD